MNLLKKGEGVLRALRRFRRGSKKKPAAPQAVFPIEAYFDRRWYLSSYPDVADAGMDPIAHYLAHGWLEDRAPHPLISRNLFISAYPHLVDREPLSWYIEEGRARDASPTPALDLPVYRAANADLTDAPDLLAHFLEHGWREHRHFTNAFGENEFRALEPRTPPGPGEAVRAWISSGAPVLDVARKVRGQTRYNADDPYSWAFDLDWYLASNPDVAECGVDPLKHYCELGWLERRSPHPLINLHWLFSRYPEIDDEPLIWHLRHGRPRDILLSPVFDEDAYVAFNSDLRSVVEPWAHFFSIGWREDRLFHPVFRPTHYLMQYPDITDRSISPAQHFVQSGLAENRRASPLFWPDWYADQANLDHGDQIGLLTHYLTIGFGAGVAPNPLADEGWYEEQIPEIERGRPCLAHYLDTGAYAGLSPHPLFDPAVYQALSGIEIGDGYAHFLTVGDRASLPPHRLFDSEYYNAEARSGELGPVLHYLTEGAFHGRWPNPLFDPDYFSAMVDDPKTARREGLIYYLKHPNQRRHPHPVFDAQIYAEQNADRLEGLDPLEHYLQTSPPVRSGVGLRRRLKPPSMTKRLTPLAPSSTAISVIAFVADEVTTDSLTLFTQSVQGQSHAHWELLILGAGSKTKDAASDDARIRSLRSRQRSVSTQLAEALGQIDTDRVFVCDAMPLAADALLWAMTSRAVEDNGQIRFIDARFDPVPAFRPIQAVGRLDVRPVIVADRKALTERLNQAGSGQHNTLFDLMLHLSADGQNITHEGIDLRLAEPGYIDTSALSSINAFLSARRVPIKARQHSPKSPWTRLSPMRVKQTGKLEFVVGGGRSDAAIQRTVMRLTALADVTVSIARNGDFATLLQRRPETESDCVIYVDAAIERLADDWLNRLLSHLQDKGVAIASIALTDSATTTPGDAETDTLDPLRDVIVAIKGVALSLVDTNIDIKGIASGFPLIAELATGSGWRLLRLVDEDLKLAATPIQRPTLDDRLDRATQLAVRRESDVTNKAATKRRHPPASAKRADNYTPKPETATAKSHPGSAKSKVKPARSASDYQSTSASDKPHGNGDPSAEKGKSDDKRTPTPKVPQTAEARRSLPESR